MARTDSRANSLANSLGIAPFDPAQYLQDEASVAEFLNASVEMNDPTVLLNALSTVARARSMTQLAAASGLGRESLYKALAPGAQPRYETVMRVLHALGVEIALRPVAASPALQANAAKRRAAPAAVASRPASAKRAAGANRAAAATRSSRPGK